MANTTKGHKARARPIDPKSPKGRVAKLMLSGTKTFEDIKKATRTTESNVRQHARQIRLRGFKYTVDKDGRVKLDATEQQLFAA